MQRHDIVPLTILGLLLLPSLCYWRWASYATIQLYEHHAPIQDVSEQLGHSSIKITVDTYGHPRQGTSIALADRLDQPDGNTLLYAPSAQPEQSSVIANLVVSMS
jgi:hypothetical protein